jgi:DNA polymerase III sliding clamp (beta) subunit (PCNA family)
MSTTTLTEKTMTTTASPITAGSIIINREPLIDGLQMIATVIPSKNWKPVLMCVHIETDLFGHVAFRGTNLEQAAGFATAQVQVESPLRTCVDADALLKRLRLMTGDVVSMRVQGDTLRLFNDSLDYTLPTQNPDEFPPSPKIEEPSSNPLKVNAADFSLAVDRAAKRVGEYRLSSGGIELLPHKDGIEVRGMDGKGMASTIIAGEGVTPEAVSIPLSAAKAISAMATGEEIEITSHGGNLYFGCDDYWLATLTLERKPQDFSEHIKVFKQTLAIGATASVESLAHSIGACTVINNDLGVSEVAMQFSAKGIEMETIGKGQTLKQAFPCKVEGGERRITLNATKLLSIIRDIDGDECSLRLPTGSDSQVLIEPVGPNYGKQEFYLAGINR